MFLILMMFCLQNITYSQNRVIQSRLVDSGNHPIMYATVILQNSDKGIIAAQLSDSIGHFRFDEVSLPVIMIVRHIAYESDTLVIDNGPIPASICLKERTNNLGEVVVSATTPFVKVKEDVFIYNMSHVRHHRAVLNAYESLREIPGIIEDNKKLLLAGSSELKIIVDGQLSSLSAEQMLAMLKSTPASKVKEIEVMYNAPAQYNTNGAVINIKLKEKTDHGHPFNGEIGMDYAQSYYATGNLKANLSFNKKKFRMDIIGDFRKGKTWNNATAYTLHAIDNETEEINEKTLSLGNSTSFNSRIGANYRFNSESNLVFSYYFQGIKDATTNVSNTIYNADSEIQSRNDSHDNSYLHNVNLQYTFKKMNVAMDYIHYHNPTRISYQDNGEEELKIEEKSLTLQNVDKYSFLVNNVSAIGSRLHIGYGVNLKYNESRSKIEYFHAEGDEYVEEEERRLRSKQEETDLNLFAEVRYKPNDRLSIRAALKPNYFKAEYDDGNSRKTLWDDFILYPNLSISYAHNKDNNFQLNFATNKRYPSYWAVNPQTTNLSSYTSIVGNPELKPSRTFTGRVIYTYRQKYTLMGTIHYSPDFFIQIPHMSENLLKMIYRYENFDYRLQSGLMLLIPVQWGQRANTQFTIVGSRTTEKKADFYGSSFNNTFYDAYISMNNSLNLTSRWLLQLDVSYRSPSRQGVYKLGHTLGGSIRLKWDITDAAYVTLRYDNLFQRQMPRPMLVSYGGQYRSIRNEEKSEFGISFTWNLGSFKNKRYNIVDTQRLSK